MPSAKNLFTQEEKDKLVQCIRTAESHTSGELRVHIEDFCAENPYEKAIEVFYKLNMHHTKARNGVLIYLATQDRKHAIIADKGINESVPADFWNHILEKMTEHFKSYDFYKGLEHAVLETGIQLKKYFPLETGDKNELNDEISFGA